MAVQPSNREIAIEAAQGNVIQVIEKLEAASRNDRKALAMAKPNRSYWLRHIMRR